LSRIHAMKCLQGVVMYCITAKTAYGYPCIAKSSSSKKLWGNPCWKFITKHAGTLFKTVRYERKLDLNLIKKLMLTKGLFDFYFIMFNCPFH